MSRFATNIPRLLWISLIPIAVTASEAEAAATRYTVTHLGVLAEGGGSYGARDINESGDIVGTWSGGAFLYRDGQMTRLAQGNGQSINDLGQVAPVGTYAINNSGLMVSEELNYLAPDGSASTQGYVTNGDTRSYLGPNTSAFGINDRGQITGMLHLPDGVMHPLLYSNGRVTDLGLLPGATSAAAYGINDAGDVVGGAMNGPSHAFLYRAESLFDLGTLGGTSGRAYNINNNGQIVGYASSVSGAYRAFLYEKERMLDLNDFLPADSGWLLTSAFAINDSGQIVGTGLLNGQTSAFLLNPTAVPEPSTLLTVGGAGLVILLLVRRKQWRQAAK